MATKRKTLAELAQDLAHLDADALRAREQLIFIGALGYGDRWQAQLARDLGLATGKPISRAQVNHWLSGERAVPLHLRQPLKDLGLRIRDFLRTNADQLEIILDPPKPKPKRAPAASKTKES